MKETSIQSPFSSLPQLAKLYNLKQLKKHRQTHPSAYEAVIQHGNEWLRYFSDSPGVMLGEFVLSFCSKVG